MLPFEAAYRKPGKTFVEGFFGIPDPFDFWVGRFYVGIWGAASVGATVLGIGLILLAAGHQGDWDFWRNELSPPPRHYGLGIAPIWDGGAWQALVTFTTVAIVTWALREVDICRKLDIGYHVPVAFASAISAWVTLQWIRPLLMGCWCEGFDLGFTAHLSWISNFGFRFMNFYLNPFHAFGILGLFFGAMLLGMHGSAILGTYNTQDDPVKEVANVDNFWRDYLGYSIGELGIHAAGFWLSIFTMIISDFCILTSGTAVTDWVDFWRFPWF
jgi:photosynthetic reaction center L subunit